MIKFILYRLFISLFVIVGASIISFALISIVPGNSAESILSAELANDPKLEEVRFFMEKHGLHNTFLIQLSQWLKMLLKCNLGTSLRTGESVLIEFCSRFPATLELAVSSTLLAVIAALPLGILSAVKHNSLIDHISRIVSLWGVSMPNFWLALLLIWIFGVVLGLLPTYGYGEIKHLVLPAVTLGTGMSAILMRLQRASILEVLNKNYIRTARAKGLNEWSVIGKHAFKNTLIPVATTIGTQLAHLLSGVVIVEQIFAWPGIGHFLVDSINTKDFPVIQGFVLIIAFFYVCINLAVDIFYALFDPRIRYGGRN
ncbi:MAG: ABC transporter permease [Desulfamplus sp.]|nr:ABC transporter permease [Desulfamplus sp.]